MREDFYYRIHIIPIYLPPLRERKEDIPLLIEHIMKRAESGNEFISVTGEMMEAMIRHDWPGNVRELQNVLHRFQSLNRFDLVRRIPSAAVRKRHAGAP
jgi:DNA-binding NtrC family response regulator